MYIQNTCAVIIFLQILVGYSMHLDQHYYFDSNINGILEGSYTSARPQLGSLASKDFICGVAFRKMRFQTNVSNCNCRNVLIGQNYQWKCNLCPNVFWTQSNAFKAIFCSYSDWNQKIQKITETGNTNSGDWVEIKCPKNQYVSRVAVRNTGNEQGIDLGFNGMLMKCQSRNFAQSQTVKDGYDYKLSQLSSNQQGNFVSSYRLKYQKNGRLLGIDFGFEDATNIKMQFYRQLAYTYSLVNVFALPGDSGWIWRDFPQLNMNITIERSKLYYVKYNIQTFRTQGTTGWLSTRLIINNKQQKEFRFVTADTRHHFNQVSSMIYLQAGVNTFQVKYRTDGIFKNIADYDWNCAILKVIES